MKKKTPQIIERNFGNIFDAINSEFGIILMFLSSILYLLFFEKSYDHYIMAFIVFLMFIPICVLIIISKRRKCNEF